MIDWLLMPGKCKNEIREFIEPNIYSMENIINYQKFLNEGIRSSEAHRDQDAIRTILDGKRDLAFIAISAQKLLDPRDSIEALGVAINNGLNLIPVRNRKDGVAFVVYKNDAKSAQKLADFAAEKNGYLRDDTPEEAEFIGQSLGYDPEDIQDYIITRHKSSPQ